MRTTLTLEPDVGARLQRMRAHRKSSLKAVVNAVMREGLDHLEAPDRMHKPFQTQSVDLGSCRMPLDDIGEALALAEGEAWQ